jgi:hypothetical protein
VKGYLGGGIFVRILTGVMAWLVITTSWLVPVSTIGTLVLMFVGAGLIWFWLTIGFEGAHTVRIDNREVTFLYPGRKKVRFPSWGSPKFKLVIRRDGPASTEGYYSERTYVLGWPLSGLTRESVEAIVACAERKSLHVVRSSGLGGLQTYYRIRATTRKNQGMVDQWT